MTEALIAVAVLAVGGIVGAFFKPNAEQSRPLFPQVSADASHDHAHDSHHH